MDFFDGLDDNPKQNQSQNRPKTSFAGQSKKKIEDDLDWDMDVPKSKPNLTKNQSSFTAQGHI
jgi:hypothetical protein